jgi:hypothetical protein
MNKSVQDQQLREDTKYEDYFDDVNFLLAKQKRYDQVTFKDEDDSIEQLNALRFLSNKYSTMKLSERIVTLHQKGSSKIANERQQQQDHQQSKKKALLLEHVRPASNRQLALYNQGVEKIRNQQKGKSSSKSNHQHINNIVAHVTYAKTVASRRTDRRQKHLYALGVKKLRQTRQGEESFLTPCKAPNKANNNYYKRLYQQLHSLVASTIDHHTMGASCNSTCFLSSANNSKSLHHVTENGNRALLVHPVNIKKKEVCSTQVTAGGFPSNLEQSLNFPELHNLRINPGIATTLSKGMKIHRNIQHLGIKPWDESHPGTTKSSNSHAITTMKRTTVPKRNSSVGFSCTNGPHQKNHNGIDIRALEVGLHGIVYQYLLDVMEDMKRSKVLGKLGMALEDLEVQSVSSRDCVVINLLSDSEAEDSDVTSTTKLQECKQEILAQSGTSNTLVDPITVCPEISDVQNQSGLNVILQSIGESFSYSSTSSTIYHTQYSSSSDASSGTVGSMLMYLHISSDKACDEMKERSIDVDRTSKNLSGIGKNNHRHTLSRRHVRIHKTTNKEGDIELQITS